MKRRAVFLDRDGTLVVEKHYLSRPEDLDLYPGALEALALLRSGGYALVLLTNQSGIARGLFSPADLVRVHRRLEELLEAGDQSLDGIYSCPHLPDAPLREYRLACDCRKPAPGLLDRAARELDLELAGSWVVGDKPSDLELGARRDLRSILVRSGYGGCSEAELSGAVPAAVVDDLLAAARWIVSADAAAPPESLESATEAFRGERNGEALP